MRNLQSFTNREWALLLFVGLWGSGYCAVAVFHGAGLSARPYLEWFLRVPSGLRQPGTSMLS
jgi:hypothetical protein